MITVNIMNLTKSEMKYGTKIRIYDNGGKSLDRYTAIVPKQDTKYLESNGVWNCIAFSSAPFHSFGMWVSASAGSHLGKRIHINNLPEDAIKFVKSSYKEYFK